MTTKEKLDAIEREVLASASLYKIDPTYIRDVAARIMVSDNVHAAKIFATDAISIGAVQWTLDAIIGDLAHLQIKTASQPVVASDVEPIKAVSEIGAFRIYMKSDAFKALRPELRMAACDRLSAMENDNRGRAFRAKVDAAVLIEIKKVPGWETMAPEARLSIHNRVQMEMQTAERKERAAV